MDGVLQKVVAAIISIVIFFILPVYVAYEKKDDISYALALKITTDFVDNVNSKGYITSDMYSDFITKLAVTGNSYDVYLEHTAKKYNPVIYSYTDDLTTIRAKFDYNLYKDQYEAGQIVTDDGTYSNLILAYDMSEKKYTEDQILEVISSTDRSLTINTSLDAYTSMDYRSIPAITSIYMPDSATQVYTLNEGDEFNVIVKNKNTTLASVLYSFITFGVSSQNTTRIYVNYGGTVKAETYRDKTVDDDTVNYNAASEVTETTSSLVNSYITDGLVLLLNGEYNDGTTHSNSTDVWKDISGNGNNATLSGFDFDDESGWIYNGLHFTGDEYVSLMNLDSSEFTIEVVVKFDTVTDSSLDEQSVISSLNSGGARLVLNQLSATEVSKRGKFSFDVYTTDEEDTISSVTGSDVVQANKIYSISGSVGMIALSTDGSGIAYETAAQILSVNGVSDGIDFNYTYKSPASGTTLVLGASPLAGADAVTQFSGTIYCVRVYNRALTEEEIYENYKIDQERYGIE